MSNTHHARATSRLHNGTTNEVARAQAEATLALAYEQRTANLIAFYGTVPTPKLGADTQKLRGQIIERLDLS